MASVVDIAAAGAIGLIATGFSAAQVGEKREENNGES
jgi:hypothetical protein